MQQTVSIFFSVFIWEISEQTSYAMMDGYGFPSP